MLLDDTDGICSILRSGRLELFMLYLRMFPPFSASQSGLLNEPASLYSVLGPSPAAFTN
jgi:hypothetical protein